MSIPSKPTTWIHTRKTLINAEVNHQTCERFYQLFFVLDDVMDQLQTKDGVCSGLYNFSGPRFQICDEATSCFSDSRLQEAEQLKVQPMAVDMESLDYFGRCDPSNVSTHIQFDASHETFRLRLIKSV